MADRLLSALIYSLPLLAHASLGCSADSDEDATAGSESTAASEATGAATSSPGGSDDNVDGTATGGEPMDTGDSTGDAMTGAQNDCATADLPSCPASPGAISAQLADELLANGSATALDVRGFEAYETQHVTDAGVLDAGDLRAMVDGVSGQVAPPQQAQMVFEAAGIGPNDALVVYGADNDTGTARVLWTLAYYGHTGKVWMLDGGLTEWTAQGYGVQMGAARGSSSVYAPVPVEALRVDAQWVLDHLDDPIVTLFDARSAEEYDYGHIPGAVSVDWGLNLGPDGLYLPAADLAALYGEPAVDQTLVVYCQTGSRASVDWLVLTMLGYSDVRIYDGSWSEWSADPSNPQE
ncbi:MAG: sulfurtransferase [Nannocystaceae bacterium]|nr:sulfurtransferase [Nannocystaceae bacterium]